MTSSLRSLEQRVRALEARIAEVEGGYGDTLYQLHRGSVGNHLGISRILQHLGLPDVTENEIDSVLDAE
jgi:hypothetical protein